MSPDPVVVPPSPCAIAITCAVANGSHEKRQGPPNPFFPGPAGMPAKSPAPLGHPPPRLCHVPPSVDACRGPPPPPPEGPLNLGSPAARPLLLAPGSLDGYCASPCPRGGKPRTPRPYRCLGIPPAPAFRARPFGARPPRPRSAAPVRAVGTRGPAGGGPPVCCVVGSVGWALSVASEARDIRLWASRNRRGAFPSERATAPFRLSPRPRQQAVSHGTSRPPKWFVFSCGPGKKGC